ncbi:uncharacterized protein TNCV_3412941 [Trichonephila clavipes]|uniref:Uncharacterized protein n=1 Tax=Trichonephila clavipes TaxID=2585209 RepID=A0A8X6UV53_TRICX|nr:uncharacterized protein TNCV_3412941 [Trichonephila clavipes]
MGSLTASMSHEAMSKFEASATRGLLATGHVILNHGQVTWTTPELAPRLLTTTPQQREDVSTLDRFNVHLCPTRRVFSGTGLEVTSQPRSDTYTTRLPRPTPFPKGKSFPASCIDDLSHSAVPL